MTCHSTQSGVLGKASNHMAVIDFHGRKVDIDVLHASLAYHVKAGFDLRAKFLLEGYTANEHGGDNGLHGQALEALFGSDRNNAAEADFSDIHDVERKTELKVSKGYHHGDLGWLPADKVKLQSQPLDIGDLSQAWEKFSAKCGQMTIVLRSQPEDDAGNAVTGRLAKIFESKLVRAFTMDFGNLSSETWEQLHREHQLICQLAAKSYKKFPGNPEKASQLVGELQSKEVKKGNIKFLYLGTSGSSDDANRSWYIRKTAFKLLFASELGSGIADCQQGDYPVADLKFHPEVYTSLAGYSEEDIREFLDPDSVVRNAPQASKASEKQQVKKPKVVYEQERIFCESCFTALGLAQSGSLCDSCSG